jgi:NAD(P) transhydrogenase
MTERFDMVVIGGGPAGEKAATQAAYFGKRVAVVERQPSPGGASVSNGTYPTKTLRETALYVTGFRARDVYGVSLHLDAQTALLHLRTRTQEIVETMTAAVTANLDRHGIEVIRGTGRLAADRCVLVTGADGSERSLQGDVVLIATGSHPFHPPGIPFDDPDVLDSETALAVEKAFESVVVIGGGPIACEYASTFAALGIDVTLVDSAKGLLSFMDDEISALLADYFRRIGIRVCLGAGRASVDRDETGLRVVLADGEVLRPQKVLFAAGRSGNTEGLGLEELGIALDERGRVCVDERFCTNVEGIYAAGDVIGPPALASVSMEQGRVAACHAFGIPFKLTVDPLPPFGVYSVPECAMIGMTEEEAQSLGVDYCVGRAWFTGNTRATISGVTDGLIKIVFRRSDRQLLGVHIIGAAAAELIHQAQAVLHFGGSIDYFIHSTYNVPTESEAFKYAAYNGLQNLERPPA